MTSGAEHCLLVQVNPVSTSGRRPASAPVQGLAKRARLPDASIEPRPKLLEQRVGSLDYLLTADHRAQGISEPSALHQPGGMPQAPELSFAGHEALQMPGAVPPSRMVSALAPILPSPLKICNIMKCKFHLYNNHSLHN